MEKMIDSIFDWLEGPGEKFIWFFICFAVGYFTGVVVFEVGG